MVLETEITYFEEHKAEWLKVYKTQFALIKDRELLGTFTTHDEAYQEGINKLGNQPFLIKQVIEEEELVQFPALTVGVINAHP